MEHDEQTDDLAEEALRLALGGAEEARIRRMASIFLGQSGGSTSSVEALAAALRDPDKTVRAEAVRSLVACGPTGFPVLLAALRDPDWRVRYRAAEGLGLLGERRAVAPLLRALTDEREHVRYMAAKALGLIADPAARAALLPLLRDPNPPARKAAATALGAIGGAEDALEAALADEPSGAVRRAVRDALGRS
ncbi:HEAT repeat domain-containing protein [Methanofollis formosanus]|uniref:HEAT repeat domain-containing protein n=1 Tax=Methanofollis formosanus TaxID=299308 RepID=A0A8G1EGG6_9EURY|nr:HEAT repeat domain-containing protein [Methanofollis formosanus]QYZ79813.1 HEAT repeat domain-containing protein [Methanofollis formosanus]